MKNLILCLLIIDIKFGDRLYSKEKRRASLQTHPCNENRVFPVYFFSQGKTCFHYLGSL